MKKIIFILTETEETSRTSFGRKIRNQELGFQKSRAARGDVRYKVLREPREKAGLEIEV